MKRPSKNGEYFLMDSTAVISRSENASFLELAYNSKGIHLLRINEMILYSATRTLLLLFSSILRSGLSNIEIIHALPVLQWFPIVKKNVHEMIRLRYER